MNACPWSFRLPRMRLMGRTCGVVDRLTAHVAADVGRCPADDRVCAGDPGDGAAMKAHPFADVLPLLEGEAFDSLVADIRANGLLEPITIHEGLILDGRNRYRACEAAGIEPKFLEFDGDDPLGFVLSLNVHRRHLSESQRGMVVAKLATMRQGGDRKSARLPQICLLIEGRSPRC